MDRPHQVAIGGSHQILPGAGHELILKSSPLKGGPDCQESMWATLSRASDPVHVVPQAVRGVTWKMNDEKEPIIMLHCLKDDSTASDLRCGTVYSPLSRYSTSGGPGARSGLRLMMRIFCCVGGRMQVGFS